MSIIMKLQWIKCNDSLFNRQKPCLMVKMSMSVIGHWPFPDQFQYLAINFGQPNLLHFQWDGNQ